MNKKIVFFIIVSLYFLSNVSGQSRYLTIADSLEYQQKKKQVLLEMSKPNPEREKREKEITEKKQNQAEDRMKTAEFVFEGEVIKGEAYYCKDINGDKRVRHSTIINISKVFKGNLKLGTVEIITENEDIPFLSTDRERSTITDNAAIYFVKTAIEFPYNKLYNIDKVDNKNILTYYPEEIVFNLDINNGKWSTPKVYSSNKPIEFPTKDSLYSYLRKIEGLNIPDKAEKWVDKKVQKVQANPYSKQRNDSIQRIIDKQMQMKFELKKKENMVPNPALSNKIAKVNSATQAVNLTYTMSNFTTTYSGSAVYLEYDVNVSSPSSVYLVDALMDIQYDNSFASSIVSAGKCTVTRYSQFNNSTYTLFSVADRTTNVFYISINQGYPTPNTGRVLINSTPQKLVHIKMEVSTTYNTTAQILFNTTEAYDYADYTIGINDDYLNSYFFDNIYFTNHSGNVPLCPVPIITGVTSSTLTAGRDQVISIYGSGFGGLRGTNGGVWFKSGDDGGSNYVAVDKNLADFQVSGTTEYWTDTEIRMKLPSVIKYFISTNNYGSFKIGDGGIKLTNSMSKTSGEYGIIVAQNYLQFTNDDGSIKKPSYLKNSAGASSITFSLGSSLLANAQATALVKRALADWACHLNITIAVVPNSVNTINFGTLTLPTLMRTANSWSSLSLPPCYATVSTITIKPDYAWDYSTPGAGMNGQDFYAAILHEIGHALMLNHVNNPSLHGGALMYYNQNTTSNEAFRLTLNNNTVATTDAQYIATQSQSAGLLSIETVTDVCPAIMTLPTVSAICYDNSSIQLDWDYISDASSYSIETSNNSGSGYTFLATIPNNYTTSYTHTGLSQWSTHYYRIRAFNQYGFSGYSNEISKMVYKDTATKTDEISGTADIISIYPNPADKTVFVSFKQSQTTNANIVIQSFSGSTLIETGKFAITEQTKAIDISTLRSGIYLLKVETDKQVVSSKLIVK